MAIETKSKPRQVTLKDVKSNLKVKQLIEGANEMMKAMGYTEHGQRHVEVVAGITRYILERLEAEERYVELAMIAAHLHDIGNVINRIDHPLTGAGIAFRLLDEMGMPTDEIVPILGAIGNHEELAGVRAHTQRADGHAASLDRRTQGAPPPRKSLRLRQRWCRSRRRGW